MAKIKIQNFGGEVPRTSPTMLKDGDATQALNVRLYSGELRVWGGPALEYTPPIVNIESIFKFINPNTLEDLWLTWTSDVDVQPSSLADETDFRLYYTGDGTPKKTNWAMAGDYTLGGVFPGAFLEMGVPAPTGAPTVADTASGSALSAEDRYYVYTHVSTFGSITEESAPSPVSSLVTVAAGNKVTVSGFAALPVGNYNITHRRIYRTLPGEQSDGAFVFVAEIAVGTSSYVDDLLATGLGEPLETNLWNTPPDGLTGLTSMANGMMAGFVGNTVYFCEPYFHHAWPVQYAQSVPDEIVGLGSYGNTLVVMTVGQPYAMVGISPDQITVEKISMPEPCVSKRSIASDAYGVLYASPNGVVAIGPSSRSVITNSLFRRNEWQEYAPTTVVGAIYDGKYFASFQSGTKGAITMVISRDDYPALSFMDFRARTFFNELRSGALFFSDPEDDKIYQLDGDPQNPLFYQWQSKRLVFEKAMSWSCLRVDVSELEVAANANYNQLIADIIAANAAVVDDMGAFNDVAFDTWAYNTSLLQEIPPPSSAVTATILLIGELDELMAALTINSFDPIRVPAFKSRELKIKLTGNLSIRSVSLATSFRELREEF